VRCCRCANSLAAGARFGARAASTADTVRSSVRWCTGGRRWWMGGRGSCRTGGGKDTGRQAPRAAGRAELSQSEESCGVHAPGGAQPSGGVGSMRAGVRKIGLVPPSMIGCRERSNAAVVPFEPFIPFQRQTALFSKKQDASPARRRKELQVAARHFPLFLWSGLFRRCGFCLTGSRENASE